MDSLKPLLKYSLSNNSIMKKTSIVVIVVYNIGNRFECNDLSIKFNMYDKFMNVEKLNRLFFNLRQV
jgi:hypothetical protein